MFTEEQRAAEIAKKLQEALTSLSCAVELENPQLGAHLRAALGARLKGEAAENAGRAINQWLKSNALQNPNAAICILVSRRWGNLKMKLLDLVVEFAAKGMGDVTDAMQSVREDSEKTSAAVKRFGQEAQSSIIVTTAGIKALSPSLESTGAAAGKSLGGIAASTKALTAQVIGAATATKAANMTLATMTKSFETIGSYAKLAFAGITGSLTGFITAGLHGTAIGEMLSFQMGQLSRTISGLFRPELEKLISGIRTVTEWLRGLSDSQRESIVNWIKGGVAALGLATVLPKLVGGIASVAVGLRALQAAIIGVESSTGIGALLPLIGMGISVLAGFAVGTETGRDAIGKMWQAIQPLVNAFQHLWQATAPIRKVLGEMFTEALTTTVDLLAKGIDLIAIGLAKVADVAARVITTLGRLAGFNIDLTSKTNSGARDRGPMGDANGPVTRNIQDSWRRIQESSYDSIPTKQLDEAKKQTQALTGIGQALQNLRPAIVR